MSKEDKSFIESWLQECDGECVLLIVTPTGSGISSWLFETAIPDHGMETVIVNPHTSKIKVQIHDAYKSSITPLGTRKILVLHGYDVLVNDSTMLTDATSNLKDPGIPTICIGHVSRTVEKKFGNMFKAWTQRIIHVMPKVEDIMDLLQATVEVDSTRAKELSVECRGDVRQAVMRSQYHEFHAKDDFYEAEQVMTMLRQGSLSHSNEIYRAARGDRQVLSLGMFESYDPLQCLNVSDMYSLLDGVPQDVQETQEWYEYLLVTYPALHFKERKVPKKTTFTYGMIWSKSHLLANKSKQAKQVCTDISHVTLRPTTQCITDDFPIFRNMMRLYDGTTGPPPWIRRGMDAKSILKVMRLWKTPWYNHPKTVKWIQSWSTKESNE